MNKDQEFYRKGKGSHSFRILFSHQTMGTSSPLSNRITSLSSVSVRDSVEGTFLELEDLGLRPGVISFWLHSVRGTPDLVLGLLFLSPALCPQMWVFLSWLWLLHLKNKVVELDDDQWHVCSNGNFSTGQNSLIWGTNLKSFWWWPFGEMSWGGTPFGEKFWMQI